jgi:predicted regulator of Ras-like GTPase activity (Roadblock/LC7/MglB family)
MFRANRAKSFFKKKMEQMLVDLKKNGTFAYPMEKGAFFLVLWDVTKTQEGKSEH